MRPLVIFSHANGFPAGTYRKLFSLLEPQVEVRALDMFAHDPRFPVNDNWSNLASELLAFIKTSLQGQGDRPVYGVGHSMGAVVTFMAAYREPARFRGLIMLDPPIISGWPAYVFQMVKWLGMADRVMPAGKSKYRRVQWPARADTHADFARKKLFAGWDPDCLRDYVECGTELRDGGAHLRFQLASELAVFRTAPSNPHRYLRKLAVPGLVVTGEDSEVALPQHLAHLQRRHGMVLRTTSGGHMFPMQYPEETARLILAQIHAWETGHVA